MTDFGACRQVFDGRFDLLGGLELFAIDSYLAVFLDLDGCAELLELADLLATRTDDRADLVGRDLYHEDARSALIDFRTVIGQHRPHLLENVKSPPPCLFERLAHDRRGDPLDLDIHLQGGDTIACPSDFEVHVTECVFGPEYVAQDPVALTVCNQTHSDARHGLSDRHPGVHQRKRAGADTRHRARAVRLQGLGDHANHVGEVVLARDDTL